MHALFKTLTLTNQLTPSENIALVEAKTLFKIPGMLDFAKSAGKTFMAIAHDAYNYKPDAFFTYYFMGRREGNKLIISSKTPGVTYTYTQVTFEPSHTGTLIKIQPFTRPRYLPQILFLFLLTCLAAVSSPILWFVNKPILAILVPLVLTILFFIPIYLAFKWSVRYLTRNLKEILVKKEGEK
ncbi:MAG: hypothetical protein Q7N87_01715 [Candidatus Uhrbacteria bacterium]|nr:hypothetical protein [Candidatus Uhrbacteria bacterium]